MLELLIISCLLYVLYRFNQLYLDLKIQIDQLQCRVWKCEDLIDEELERQGRLKKSESLNDFYKSRESLSYSREQLNEVAKLKKSESRELLRTKSLERLSDLSKPTAIRSEVAKPMSIKTVDLSRSILDLGTLEETRLLPLLKLLLIQKSSSLSSLQFSIQSKNGDFLLMDEIFRLLTELLIKNKNSLQKLHVSCLVKEKCVLIKGPVMNPFLEQLNKKPFPILESLVLLGMELSQDSGLLLQAVLNNDENPYLEEIGISLTNSDYVKASQQPWDTQVVLAAEKK